MIRFKTVLKTTQDGDRILYGRLLHHDPLKTTLQCRILFDVFAVFVKGRRTDAAQFAACQHRFEQVGRIHRSLGLSGTDQIVDLIDEQNDTAVRILHFFQYCLQTFLKFTAVLCAGNQSTHIQFDQLLFF